MRTIKDSQERCYGLTALRSVSLQEAGVGELSVHKGSHAQINDFLMWKQEDFTVQ